MIRSELGSAKLSAMTDVILPTWADEMLLLGREKFTLLKTSNNSARNCKFTRSVILVPFRIPRSVLKNLGPRSIYRPAFPKVPTALTVNLEVSNHCNIWSPCDRP